jgi:hypothetical protein
MLRRVPGQIRAGREILHTGFAIELFQTAFAVQRQQQASARCARCSQQQQFQQRFELWKSRMHGMPRNDSLPANWKIDASSDACVTPARLGCLSLALETARFIGERTAAGGRPAYISLPAARFAVSTATRQLIKLMEKVRTRKTYEILQINR